MLCLAEVVPPCEFCELQGEQSCFQKWARATLHKGVFCAAASTFIRWLKFLQLKTSHPLVEFFVLGFFGLKICSKFYIFTRIKKASFFHMTVKDKTGV